MLLVDSGASHNYISRDIAETLGVRVRYCSPMSVHLASGDAVASDAMLFHAILARFWLWLSFRCYLALFCQF